MTALPASVETRAPLRAGGGVQSIVPQDAEQAFRMAQMIFKSGMAPRDMQSPEKIVTSIIAGMEIGLKPFQAVQSFAVVNGRPTLWGDAALGLVQASGYLEDIEEVVEGDGDAMTATCRAKRSDRKSPIVRTFGVKDAKAAGLWGKTGPWSQYPRRMLAMRARAFTLRDGFPDVLRGIGVHEEVADYSGPSSERQAEPAGVTSAALLAQAGDAPQIEPPRDAEPADRSATVTGTLTLPPLPTEESGERSAWGKRIIAEIKEAADAARIALYPAAIAAVEGLPDVLADMLAKAVKARGAEIEKAT